MERAAALDLLADRVAALPRPALVAIDGVDGVGKTVLADDLAAVLGQRGERIVRTGIDGFHRPRAQRYARGRTSPEGYFFDSFDLAAFRRCVIEPVRSGGQVRTAAFDHRSDAPVPGELVDVVGAIVLVDGVFLQRDELHGAWDLAVFLRADFVATYARMSVRDGSPADPEDPANRRYLEGQRLYLNRCRPQERADVVLDVTDVSAPVVVSGL
ncbi:nucleoside/nucleotide kinase family protein [Actinotalea fermentans]|uniref:Uridine kinase n=1 Tax=Actinotalea fermentans TaxID=43671 RepID=A0A511YTD8_9CELL|nr:hypothetical protein [Actinotalea fermentans]KGM17351.1 hypothetical protein N867_05210 [Actinotalea fermentans ATCC 43279 = JCM 9966 = DSM 3133]GEN78449.1 hypothetical protein AFE02nite_01830 [Actinotalea fermentans]